MAVQVEFEGERVHDAIINDCPWHHIPGPECGK
jgi:hypothetical protein